MVNSFSNHRVKKENKKEERDRETNREKEREREVFPEAGRKEGYEGKQGHW